jgi:hypothetical protein
MKPWPNFMHYFGTFIEAVKNTRVHLVIVSFPIPGYGLPLRGFAITLIVHITLVGLLLTSDQSD